MTNYHLSNEYFLIINYRVFYVIHQKDIDKNIIFGSNFDYNFINLTFLLNT